MLDEGGHFLFAAIGGLGATRFEAASGKLCVRTGVPDDLSLFPDGNGVRHWNGLQERLCIRVAGVSKEFVLGCQFDQAAEIHDRNMVAYMTHHRKIMGNKQVGELVLFLKVL